MGLLAAVGVPVMGLAMAQLARLGVSSDTIEEAQQQIDRRVTIDELKMMTKLGLMEGKGEISRAEYILLCAVRMNALTPELIDFINYRFHILDTSGDGALDYAEMLKIPNEIIQAPKCTLTEMLEGSYLQPGTASVSF